MSDWSLAQSYWLGLLPLPLLLYQFRRRTRAHWPQLLPKLALRFPALQTLNLGQSAAQTDNYQPQNERTLLLALLLFIFALAQPIHYSGASISTDTSEPVDLVLLVDTNITMVIEDYEVDGELVSRMELTQQLLSRFIAEFGGSQMGLSLMGDPPLHWLPFTPDREALQDAVTRLRPAIAGRLSDMAASLQLVREHYLEAGNLKVDDEPQMSRVVVMITDSSLQLGAISPQQAATALRESGAFLYVIAIGTSGQDGAHTLASDTNFVYEPVDLRLLTEVAQAGRGELFHATDLNAFREALEQIETRHRVTPDREQEPKLRLNRALYPIPLALGALLLIYSLLGPSLRLRHQA